MENVVSVKHLIIHMVRKLVVKKKNEINGKLFDFYKNYIFRKLKLNGYFYRLKSEQNLIKNFKKIFGNPENVIICFGGYEQKNI